MSVNINKRRDVNTVRIMENGNIIICTKHERIFWVQKGEKERMSTAVLKTGSLDKTREKYE